jgi:outer membrane lipoprotein LolB
MQALRVWWVSLGLLLSACAGPRALQNQSPEGDAHWQGRLSVKVFSKPVQAFSAGFDLQGRPTKGELVLTSPLGTTWATLHWDQQEATLLAHGVQQRYGSLQELASRATGADIPIASLFAWLAGQPQEAPGWQADLTELPGGRLLARHLEEVQAELKIILDR